MVLFFHFELKWKSYGHFKILKLSLFEIKILKWENGHNSLILVRNKKIAPLSFIQLLKLKRRKWYYFFHFELKWKSYGQSKILKLLFFEIKILKLENSHNSLILAGNEKITTFFYPTFKVKGKKVVLFFHFELKWSFHFLKSKSYNDQTCRSNLNPYRLSNLYQEATFT